MQLPCLFVCVSVLVMGGAGGPSYLTTSPLLLFRPAADIDDVDGV